MASDRSVALVTGATRGIGRCGALALAKRGFDVAITGRTLHEGEGRADGRAIPGSLDKTAREIQELGASALPIAMDVTDRASIRAAFDATMKHWGRIDVLVNNAPYSGPGNDAKLLDIDRSNRCGQGINLLEELLVDLLLLRYF